MQLYLLIIYALIGVLSGGLLVLSLISAGKEHRSGERLHGLFSFTLAVVCLCMLVGLAVTYVSTGRFIGR